MQRREFIAKSVGLIAASSLGAVALPVAAEDQAQKADHDMSMYPKDWTRSDQVIMVLYPGFTSLDFTGPHYFLASLMGAKVHIAAKTMNLVSADNGLTIFPTVTLKDCPRVSDLFFVPGGGEGTLAAMQDDETLAFVRDCGAKAKFVTSVCTGSLLLGVAGLLKGYKATSHWSARSLLPLVGAEAVNQRVVEDRNRITAAGVSAGLDLGLLLTSKLRDDRYAKTVQLLCEYAPKPMFNSGSPQTADPADVELMKEMMAPFLTKAEGICRKQGDKI